MKQLSEIIKKIEENKKDLEFLPTGLTKIDTFLDGGFLKKELVVLGAATGKGKSFVSSHIFYNIAKAGFKSAYFSLEISNEMIVSRLIGAIANLSPTRVMTGFLYEDEFKAKNEAKAEVSVYEEFMYFYDDIYIFAEIEKQIKENNYEFVVVDFIQNIIANKGEEYERLSFIATSLQKLAKDTNSCIMVLSQLSNVVAREKREDIVEYRGSGTIATVCDLGFFIERNEIVGDENTFSVKIRKNRRGIAGKSFDFIFKHPGGIIVET